MRIKYTLILFILSMGAGLAHAQGTLPAGAGPDPESALAEDLASRMHIKTNVVGLGMLMGNAALEFDLLEHWSIALPVYYSDLNWFADDVKFHILSFQPELRFWLSGRNDGVFFGGHLGIAYYNFAFKGDYRYQDHNGDTPAIGAGLAAGYRLPISRDKRLKLEFSVGAGLYQLSYDKFNNTPDGKLAGSVQKVYAGPDQVAVTLSYALGGKKGGDR